MTARERAAMQPTRVDGYAPLRDYAVVGAGRTVTLVARDGTVDWLAWPNLDSPSTFAAVLDAERGGSFRSQPEAPYTVERGCLPDTNVLQSRFTTTEREGVDAGIDGTAVRAELDRVAGGRRSGAGR